MAFLFLEIAAGGGLDGIGRLSSAHDPARTDTGPFSRRTKHTLKTPSISAAAEA